METVIPPKSGQQQSAPLPATHSGGTGTLTKSTVAADQQLQSGKPLEGQVVAQSRPGQVTVETKQGRVTIETQAGLPKGTTVTITQASPATGTATNAQVKIQIPQTGTGPSAPAKPVQLPPAVSSTLSSGQPVQAQVADSPTPGRMILQTPQGRVTLETATNLPKGTTVTLTQPGGNPNATIRIQPQPAPASPPSAPAKPVQLPPTVSSTLSSGQPVQAQVADSPTPGRMILQTPQGRVTLETAANLPKGTTVTLTQPGGNPNAPIRIQPQPAPASPPSAPAKPVQLPPTVSSTLSSGQPVQAQVADSPTPGRLILQTPQGTITVETQANLPRGTAVTLTQTGGGSNPVVTIQPQPTPQPAAPQGTGNPGLSTTTPTSQLPPQVSSLLSSGQPVQAHVTGSPGQGLLTLQTAHGQVTITSGQALPNGTAVTITQTGVSGNTSLLQLQPQSLPVIPGDAETILTNLTLGTRFTATILSAHIARSSPLPTGAGQAQPQTTASGTSPASQFSLQNQPTASASTTTASPQPQPQTAVAPQTGQPSSPPQPGQIAGQQQPQSLPPGHSLPVRLVGIQIPGSAPLALPEALPAGQILLSGTVTSSSNGQTTVQTPSGTLSLPTSQTLPIGTILQLTALGTPQPLAELPGLESLFSAERWQALSDAVTLLQAGDVATAQRLIQLVPQNTPQLGNAMLFLFSALRIGSAERWVGKDILRTLDQLQAGSAAKLGESVQAAQTRATDTSGQDWKVFHMPFLSDSELEELRLYLRDKEAQHETKDNDGEDDKRFVIEANFTRLGPMQFDGFSRKKQFDLMIRTHETLPGTMRDDIRQLFANAISALGFSGSVGFHVTEKFEISAEELREGHRGGVTV